MQEGFISAGIWMDPVHHDKKDMVAGSFMAVGECGSLVISQQTSNQREIDAGPSKSILILRFQVLPCRILTNPPAIQLCPRILYHKPKKASVVTWI